jgi:D-alanyl-D-alanine carboxypeptidase
MLKFTVLILFFAKIALSYNPKNLGNLLDYLSEKGQFNGQIFLHKNSKKNDLFSRGFATVDKIEINENTKFRIGSISKIFTAVLIMQEIEKGNLELGTPLSKYFPEIMNAEGISIKMLLNHHSGIFNITSDPTYSQWMTQEQSRENLVNRIKIKGVNFEPGAKYEYSNSNYILLSYIMEDITEMSFAEILKKNIVEKIGLENTYAGNGLKPDNNEAESFIISGETLTKMPETEPSVPIGAGVIVSTPKELVKFMRSLFDGKLISEESLELMLPKGEDSYELGIAKFYFDDKLAYGHNGGIDGFVANVSYFPEDSSSFAICTNTPSYDLNELMIASYRAMNDIPIDFPDLDQYILSEKEKKRYAGVFTSPNLPFEVTLTATEDGLSAQATGQPSFNLFIESSTVFTYDIVKLKIEFEKSDKEIWDKFTLTQFGQKYEFTRKK